MANRIQRLVSVPDAFLKELPAVQRKLFLSLIERLNKVATKDGFIVPSIENFKIVDEISEFISNELLTKTSYAKSVKEFANEFDTQKELTKTYYQTTFEKSVFETLIADRAVALQKKAVVEALITDTVREGFLKPLESVLNTAVNSGASFTETLSYLRDFVEGNDNVDGAVLKYSKQLAHDSFANSDRAYNSAVADELDIEWFIWAGGEIATTRCFCLERHGKYYHYKEIEAWGRGDDVGECGFPWAGMNRGTNEQTIYTFGGGYGCLHTVAGTSLFAVPKADVQRNIDNGNFVPTDFELGLLGM